MMLSFVLWVLNSILWGWSIIALCVLPFAIRMLYKEDEIYVGDLIGAILGTLCWFLCIEDIMEEIENTFGWKYGTIEDKLKELLEIKLWSKEE